MCWCWLPCQGEKRGNASHTAVLHYSTPHLPLTSFCPLQEVNAVTAQCLALREQVTIYEEQLAAAEARRELVRRDVHVWRAEAGRVNIAAKITLVALSTELELWPWLWSDMVVTNAAATSPVTILMRIVGFPLYFKGQFLAS